MRGSSGAKVLDHLPAPVVVTARGPSRVEWGVTLHGVGEQRLQRALRHLEPLQRPAESFDDGADVQADRVMHEPIDVEVVEMVIEDSQPYRERTKDVKMLEGVEQRPFAVKDWHAASLVHPHVDGSKELALHDRDDLVARPRHHPGT